MGLVVGCCWSSLVVGCWLLVVGCCLLVAGCWLLVAGCWLLVHDCWLLAAGCWPLVAGWWLLVVGCWLLVVGCCLLVVDVPEFIFPINNYCWLRNVAFSPDCFACRLGNTNNRPAVSRLVVTFLALLPALLA